MSRPNSGKVWGYTVVDQTVGPLIAWETILAVSPLLRELNFYIWFDLHFLLSSTLKPSKMCLFLFYFQLLSLSFFHDTVLSFVKTGFCFLSVHLLDFIVYKSSLRKFTPWEIHSKTKCYYFACSWQNCLWTCLEPHAHCKEFPRTHIYYNEHLAQDERKMMFPFIYTTSSFVTCLIHSLAAFILIKVY